MEHFSRVTNLIKFKFKGGVGGGGHSYCLETSPCIVLVGQCQYCKKLSG